MSGKTGRLEAERMLLIALLCEQLHGMAEAVGAEAASSLLDEVRACADPFTKELFGELQPYLAAMGVDAQSPELQAAFSERLKSAADVLERIQGEQRMASQPEEPAS